MRCVRRVVCGAALTAMMVAVTVPGSAAAAGVEKPDRAGFTFAVIGDIPYGDAQIARFPKVVDQINADPAVQLVDHLGDIKSGSSVCSDGYFDMIRTQFDRFVDPLVYTPGDNEWTDCHRTNNGAYNPLERLAAVRKEFFPRPNRTLGQHPVSVDSQAGRGFVENVRYSRARVDFAALHIAGSNNSLLPWTGLGKTTVTAEQLTEVTRRTAAVLALIDQTFDHAKREHQKAVVLLTQADMFDVTVPNPVFADYSGFQEIVRRIAERSAAFGRPVYLLNGDSHVYNVDKPLASDSRWLSFYDVHTAAPNLTRVTVDGSTGVNDYLRVTADPSTPAVVTWEQVPFATP